MKKFICLLLPLCYWSGCAMFNNTSFLKDGRYVLDAPNFYQGSCEVRNMGSYYKIEMLEKRKGSFGLKSSSPTCFKIVKSDVGFDKIRRSISGKGCLTTTDRIEGKAKISTVNIAFFSRDHRKVKWSLRPAAGE